MEIRKRNQKAEEKEEIRIWQRQIKIKFFQ